MDAACARRKISVRRSGAAHGKRGWVRFYWFGGGLSRRTRLRFENEEIELARMLEVPRGKLGIGAFTPENVGPARPHDRPAGVLVQHEPAAIHPGLDLAGGLAQRLFRLDERQHRRRENFSIQGEGAPRRQPDVQRAQGASRRDREEDKAGVKVEHMLDLEGVIAQISPDALHGHFLARNLALVDQQLPDTAVGPAVAAVVVDVDHLAVIERDLARALDVQKEKVDRVVDPGDRLNFPVQDAFLLDLAALIVRHQRPVAHSAHDLLTLELFGKGPQVDGDEILRPRVDRVGVLGLAGPAASQDGFVVAGEEHFVLGVAAHRLVDQIVVADEILQAAGGRSVYDEGLEALQRFQNVPGADAVGAEHVLALRRLALQIGDALADGLLKVVKVQVVSEMRIAGR